MNEHVRTVEIHGRYKQDLIALVEGNVFYKCAQHATFIMEPTERYASMYIQLVMLSDFCYRASKLSHYLYLSYILIF